MASKGVLSSHAISIIRDKSASENSGVSFFIFGEEPGVGLKSGAGVQYMQYIAHYSDHILFNVSEK